MEYMRNFLHRKTYRTYAVLISGAAMVMAATALNENIDNNKAGNEGLNGQAISHCIDTGDDEEEAAPGYLSLNVLTLRAVQEVQTDKPQTEAVDIPQVSLNNVEEQTVENSDENTDADYNTDTETMGNAVSISEEEYVALQRIVEAEAGNQDDIGRILVANVVLNRVKSEQYPDTIIENIFKHSGDVYQFQPVQDGAYYSVTVSEKTKECVDRAISGEDYSQGALYFTRETSADSWFNTSLTLLFVHGAHYFYK